MNPPDTTSAAPWSKPCAAKWKLPVLLLSVIVGGLALKVILPPHWHARLELKNTGTRPMTVLFRGATTVTQPGGSWKGDFRGGDMITIQPADAGSGTWHNINMPATNPKPWTIAGSTAQHWTAEVNADDPANIRVEKRVWTEVTNPPSPWLPWP